MNNLYSAQKNSFFYQLNIGGIGGLDGWLGKPKLKLMKELNKNESVGPILLGLKEPIHVLQLGASVEEIVNMASVASNLML